MSLGLSFYCQENSFCIISSTFASLFSSFLSLLLSVVDVYALDLFLTFVDPNTSLSTAFEDLKPDKKKN